MIGVDLELAQCMVLIVGNRTANRTVTERFLAQGSTLLFAEDPQQAAELIGQAGLLVVCDAEPERFDAVVSTARIPVMRAQPAAPAGSITLLGGGPGALDLMTLRGVRALAEAEVIYADRLGPSEHLAVLAPQAKIIDAGKLPGHHKLTQREIEAQMIQSAKAGAKVVRLKGGDPFVFGRGFEEVAAATEANVPVSVIPGLSSCITVPGAAGIPVTARGVNTMFTVVSGHDPLSLDQLEHLAKLGGSIVILMGMGTVEQTVSGLLQVGMPKDMPCAIIQSGTTDIQRTSHTQLDQLAGTARNHSNPAVIVIGEVAALPQSLVQAVPTEQILETA